MSGAVAYGPILTREFGRRKGITADQARERADELEAAADDASSRAQAERMRDAAAALRDYAGDLESGARDRYDEPETAQTGSGTPSRSRSSRRSGSSKRSTKKTTSREVQRVGRAARRATVGQPTEQAARSIESTGAIVWQFLGGLVVAILVYILVTNSQRTTSMVTTLSEAVMSFVFPPAVFGMRVTNQARKATK